MQNTTGKSSYDEILNAGKSYLELAKAEKSHKARIAYLCAARCYLRIGQYEVARNAFEFNVNGPTRRT